jgi:hypothetical protein
MKVGQESWTNEPASPVSKTRTVDDASPNFATARNETARAAPKPSVDATIVSWFSTGVYVVDVRRCDVAP